MKVSIVGSGIIGKATGIGLSQIGHDVIFYDINKQKLAELEVEGYNTAYELTDLIDCAVHMVCVPTPVPNGKMDLSIIESSIIELGKVLNNSHSRLLYQGRLSLLW